MRVDTLPYSRRLRRRREPSPGFRPPPERQIAMRSSASNSPPLHPDGFAMSSFAPNSHPVTPAKAGAQFWIPASAGMTELRREVLRLILLHLIPADLR